MILLDAWNDTSIIQGPENARFNDVWGFEQEGSLYCVLGSTEGAHFFEISNDQLTFIDFEPGRFQGSTVIHRDYKTYKNYLYAVCDEGISGLQIFDLSYLPDSVVKVYDQPAYFSICHNIYIDTIKAKLYACGPDDYGMKIFDLTDPVNPQLVYDFTMANYVHDCYVRGDTAFLNCGFDGLQIWDFGFAMPHQLGILDFYPNQGYNHSGWLSPSGKNYVFADETEGAKLSLCRANQLSQIQINQQFGASQFQNHVPHNVILMEKLAFVAYYNLGLRIFDISTSPIKEVGFYDTFYQNTQYKLNGAWGVFVFPNNDLILISDRQNGLFLFTFPIQVFESTPDNLVVTNSPFIDENGIIIPKHYFELDNLYFTITDVSGQVIYNQENYLNWVNIPLNLSAGTYIFGVFNEDRNLLESGKFIKAN